VECKLICVDFRRVSDPRRLFWLAFSVTVIPDDWYRSAMGVIVRSLGTPRSTGENFGCTWERLGSPRTNLAASGSTSDKPVSPNNKSGSPNDKSGSANNKFGRADGKSGSTSNHSTAVWEKQHPLWEHCWCAWKS